MTRVLLTAGAFSVSICRRPCTLALEFLSDESDRMMEAGPPNEAPPPWSGGGGKNSRLFFWGFFFSFCLVGFLGVWGAIWGGREVGGGRDCSFFFGAWGSAGGRFVPGGVEP